MKRRVGLAGFTIVETMIVLAVTGGLFVVIAATLSGRQRSNEFTQSINDARSRIQQVITEAKNGYFPNTDYACTASASSVIIAAGSDAQGSRTDCVFLGKVLQFNVNGHDPSEVIVYPVAGIRTKTDVLLADPSVVSNSLVDLSTNFNLKYGLTVEKTRVVGGTQNVGAFGVLSSLDTTTPGKSGDQQFDLYALSGIQLGHDKLTDATDLLSAFSKNPAAGFQICFKSGGTDQWGLITVGNNGSQLSVDLQIRNTTCW